MNRSENSFKPLAWLMTLLLAAFVAGCGDGEGSAATTTTASPTAPGVGTGLSGSGKGPAPVVLGRGGSYVILAKSAISTTGVTAVTGNVGLSPTAASFITGFSLSAPPTTFSTSSQVTGQVFAADYDPPTPTNLTTAVNDMLTAYTDAAGRAPDYTEVGAGDIGGLTLPLPPTNGVPEF